MMGIPGATEMWAGEFGNEYHRRQQNIVAANIAFFARALARTRDLNRIVELGAGTGMNIEALRRLLPHAHLQAVEVNAQAAEQIAFADSVFCQNILDFEPAVETPADLVITKGLLIHIPPIDLPAAYTKIINSTQRYILIAEYFSPEPTMIPYHGQDNMLWKRDFAGEMIFCRPWLRLIDYGFVGRADTMWPQDNLNWWLMEKQ